MKMKYLIITILITPSLSQYMQTGLKPDVTFGEHNDRFDISNFLRQQKYAYKDEILDPQSDEYRRSGTKKNNQKLKEHKSKRRDDTNSWLDLLETRKGRKSIRKKIVKKLEDHVNELANTIIAKMRSMRRNDFAYHDDMNSGGGDVEDYNANLKRFEAKQKLKEGFLPSRRFLDIVDNLHRVGITNLKSKANNVLKEDFVASQRIQNTVDELHADGHKDNLDKFEGNKNLGKDVLSSSNLQDIVDDLHGSKQTRRVMTDPEKEILLHYAFPLDINIEGFLQMP